MLRVHPPHIARVRNKYRAGGICMEVPGLSKTWVFYMLETSALLTDTFRAGELWHLDLSMT